MPNIRIPKLFIVTHEKTNMVRTTCIFKQALMETTDVHIYNELIRGNEEDTFLKG